MDMVILLRVSYGNRYACKQPEGEESAAQKPHPSAAGAHCLPAPAARNRQPFTDPSNDC